MGKGTGGKAIRPEFDPGTHMGEGRVNCQKLFPDFLLWPWHAHLPINVAKYGYLKVTFKLKVGPLEIEDHQIIGGPKGTTSSWNPDRHKTQGEWAVGACKS